ncbi:MAG: hypothetical protein KIC94_18770 [Clostridiales bacterium]|nr:hypothetical protein [Clostridiales bacterium]
MFEYTFENSDGDFKILTPFVKDMSEIKKESIQKADCIHDKSTFPNGVVLETIQYATKVVVKCSHELINNNDGTYSIRV